MRGPSTLSSIGAFAGSSSRRRNVPISLSYRALLGPAWSKIPPEARARFETPCASFTGTIELHATLAGRCVERLARLVGSPLPRSSRQRIPASVHVEPDALTGGSRWTRRYHVPTHVVTSVSVKAIDYDGTLVERLPCGIRMRLAVEVRDGALHFMSTGYYVELPRIGWCRARRFNLPSWGLPGRTHVVHRDLGDGSFRFTMTIRHALLGELVHHEGVFRSNGD